VLSSHQASTVQTRDHTAADSHDNIQVRGARENNLKGVSLDIPKRRLTVFTGVSGSGKSSLVFDTIAAESRRLIDETYTAFIQAFMPSLSRPDVDALHNLSAAIIVDQERMGANARSTVGTATDAHTMLRIIFSRIAEPHVGSASAFSFNMAEGMCPECEGLGKATDIDLDEVVDRELSLNEGAIKAPGYAVDSWPWQIVAGSGLFDPDAKLKDFTEEQWADLLHKPATKLKYGNNNFTYEGLLVRVRRSFLGKDRESMQPAARAFADRAIKLAPCPACDGTRLNEAARSARIHGRNIADCSAMQVNDLADFIRGIDDPRIGPVLEGLRSTLDSLVEIGLGYLSLNRESSTLSGGEAQRVKMVRHLNSSLTDVTYVFDEPTAGLHPHDIQRMNRLLLALCTRATRCSWSSTSRRPSPSPTTSWTSAPARARRAARSATPATCPGCAPPAR
jgi:excinuclease UvrABC ATPase subunit